MFIANSYNKILHTLKKFSNEKNGIMEKKKIFCGALHPPKKRNYFLNQKVVNAASSRRKNLVQIQMPEEREKCKYFNFGYCKYQDRCKLLHPKEECDYKCKIINCKKCHIKTCRYETNCIC